MAVHKKNHINFKQYASSSSAKLPRSSSLSLKLEFMQFWWQKVWVPIAYGSVTHAQVSALVSHNIPLCIDINISNFYIIGLSLL